jgi:hypothetical protein
LDGSDVNKIISGLRQLFAGVPDNLFLRGSLFLGVPTDDFDVSAYNSGGGFRTRSLPTHYKGKKLDYGSIPLENLEEYCETNLRSSSFLQESAELTHVDGDLKSLMKRQKQKLDSERRAQHIFYRLIEEQLVARSTYWIKGNDYEKYKQISGSKRTISRIMWILKSLFPTLSPSTLTEMLADKNVSNLMPDSVRESILSVSLMLFDPDRRGSPDWNKGTADISSWFNTSFSGRVMNFLRDSLDGEYVSAMHDAVSGANTGRLSEILDYAESAVLPCERWSLLIGLSSNPNISSETIYRMAAYRENFLFTDVIRNIIRNPSTTPEILEEMSSVRDKYALRDLKRRIGK